MALPDHRRHHRNGDRQMSRSIRTDYESLRESQARSQQADRIGPDQERADSYEREDHG